MKILRIIKEADKNERGYVGISHRHIVLCIDDSGANVEVAMTTEEYEYYLKKQQMIEKYPGIEDDLEDFEATIVNLNQD